LQSAQAEVEQQVKRLTETLTEETKRRRVRAAGGKIGQRRGELEAELGQLQQQLEGSPEATAKRREQSSQVKQSELRAKMKELQANRTTAEEKIKAFGGSVGGRDQASGGFLRAAKSAPVRAERSVSLAAPLVPSRRLTRPPTLPPKP